MGILSKPPLVVFSDLDGTLLDHHDYSWTAAKPALDRLRELGIPLVLASSKTALEIADIRRKMGFADCPAIVENGAGLLGTCDTAVSDRSEHERLLGVLHCMPRSLWKKFSGFSDWGPEGIAEVTGLSLKDAKKAAMRQFSEPGVWTGTAAEERDFVTALWSLGVVAKRGGRFLTLSFGATKADRMLEITDLFGKPPTLALGDAPNDIEMIEAATYGVIVNNPDGASLPKLAGEKSGRIVRTELAGPAGWNSAVQDILDRMFT